MSPRRQKKSGSDVPDISTGSSALLRKKNRGAGLIILISLVAIIVLVIAGAVYFQSNVVPFQRAVVTVDKGPISMGYLLKRTKASGGDIARTLEQLVNEQIVKSAAPQFGIQVTPADIDMALRQMASSSSSSNTTGNQTSLATDAEVKKWYQDELKRTGLTDAEYKEMAKTTLQAATLQQYLAQQVPTTQEQVRLNVIVAGSYADASAARKRIAGGEDFAAVARAVSLDAQSRQNGGDIGWIPRGLLPYDKTIFALAVKTVSEPVAINPSDPSSQYLLFLVAEKASREVDQNAMEALKARALSNWLIIELPRHSIAINYDFSSVENQAWIDWQLSRK